MPERLARREVPGPQEDPLAAALARLNEIGAAVNRLGAGDLANVRAALALIVESAVEVVPGASAVIYTYDPAAAAFDATSRVSSGNRSGQHTDDVPRPAGIGARAVAGKRRVISYEEPDLEIHPEQLLDGTQVICCYPLLVAEEALGALYVSLKEQRLFSPIELQLLDNFVNHAAMVLYLARQLKFAQQEQTRKRRELRRLHRAGLLLSSPTSVQETLAAILRMAMEVIDAHFGIFRLVDKSGKRLVSEAFIGAGLDTPALGPLPIDRRSIMGLVASTREPLLISDLRLDPYPQIYYPLDPNVEMRSELAVPLIGASGRMEGVLNLESPEIGAFSEQDRYILQVLATQAVIAIQRARLLDALQAVSALLMTAPCQEVLDHLVVQACDLLNAAAGQIWLVEEGRLKLMAKSAGSHAGESLSIHDSLTGRAIATAQAVVSPDLSRDDRLAPGERAWHENAGSALIVPILKSEDRAPIGAISIYTAAGDLRDFDDSEWEKKVLIILGHYAELAVQQAAHQEALRISQEQRAVAEAFAAVGDIAANLLHRMNNRVGTIPVRVQGIRDKSAAEIRANAYLAANLDEIERSATEAMEIVRDSLFHLRPIELAPVDVGSCVEDAVLQAALPPSISLETSGLEALPRVKAGEQRLTLVFINLLENAQDAMEGAGRIHIHGETQADQVLVSVSDSGPGIPLELQERIFEFSYSSRHAERPSKLGFGLWWVKTLMARFGGSVAVESDGRQGTTFYLRLPLSGEDS